jgi:choline dehydrogenase-like flavoprotein
VKVALEKHYSVPVSCAVTPCSIVCGYTHFAAMGFNHLHGIVTQKTTTFTFLFYCNNMKVGFCFQVTKIIIDKRTKRAKGVLYFKDGEYKMIKARKEVILSAGAVQSPQILMLSGIGPKKHLQHVGKCKA